MGANAVKRSRCSVPLSCIDMRFRAARHRPPPLVTTPSAPRPITGLGSSNPRIPPRHPISPWNCSPNQPAVAVEQGKPARRREHGALCAAANALSALPLPAHPPPPRNAQPHPVSTPRRTAARCSLQGTASRSTQPGAKVEATRLTTAPLPDRHDADHDLPSP